MTRKSFNVKFDFGSEIELRTDPGVKRVVTGFILRPSGKLYEVASGIETSWHQEVEIDKFTETTKRPGFK
jgi:hypothetical protein